MNRMSKIAVAAVLLLPAAGFAQRPSATVQTRSAMLYLQRAEESQVPAEKAKYYNNALEQAEQGVQKNAGNSQTWYTLGLIYASKGDAVGADSAFDKAEQLWPEYLKQTEDLRYRAYAAAFNHGVEAIRTNDVQGAIAALEAAQNVYTKAPTAALNLGNLYARANQMDKAAESYHAALEILRGPERARQNEATEKQWAQWEEAAAFNLAQILAGANKNEEAASAYLDYLKGNPTSVTAKSNLAIVYSRMGKTAEAQQIYQELLGMDLSPEDYFAVGVGLFRGDQFDPASQAFRKAIAKNGSMRDAYYNLAQSIYSMITPLEDARATAKPADQKNMDAQLKPLYEELQTVTQKAHELDPNNRNILALLARSYRGMADITDAKTSADLKAKTLEVLKMHGDLPVEVTDVVMTFENGEAKLAGNVVNVKATEGSPVKLTVSFLGADGTVIGTQDVTVTAPKVEDQVQFTATLKTETAPGGWKYVVGQ